MNHYCCVPQCKSWVKTNPALSFHTFPKEGKSKVILEAKLGTNELVDRRSVWIKELKIGKKMSDHMRVCSLHFKENDFLQRKRVKRRTLKRFAIPSQNLPLVSCDTYPRASTSRASRILSRELPVDDLKIRVVQPECENLAFEDQEVWEAAKSLITLLNSVKTASLLKGQVRETVR